MTRWKYFTKSETNESTLTVNNITYKKSKMLLDKEGIGAKIILVSAAVGMAVGLTVFILSHRLNLGIVCMFAAVVFANVINYFRLPKDVDNYLEIVQESEKAEIVEPADTEEPTDIEEGE